MPQMSQMKGNGFDRQPPHLWFICVFGFINLATDRILLWIAIFPSPFKPIALHLRSSVAEGFNMFVAIRIPYRDSFLCAEFFFGVSISHYTIQKPKGE